MAGAAQLPVAALRDPDELADGGSVSLPRAITPCRRPALSPRVDARVQHDLAVDGDSESARECLTAVEIDAEATMAAGLLTVTVAPGGPVQKRAA